jgi:4-methyl-5(b-hydroxyethyl)-thiazole monophosphate biosynthesis
MVKAVLFLANGFEDIEVASIIDSLRRGGVEVVVAGLHAGIIEGKFGIKVVPDTTIEEVDVDAVDTVILPGGNLCYTSLGRDRKVLDSIKKAFERGKIVAAICGAPSVLAKAGVLKGKNATIYPGAEGELTGAKPSTERVVVDGTVVTSQGPGTAIEFGVTLVKLLVGENQAQEVKAGLVASF